MLILTANIDELTFALLKHYIIYLLEKRKKKEIKERRNNIKHNDDKSVMTKSKILFRCIQTLIKHDGSKPHFHLFGYPYHFKVMVDKLYSTQTLS